MREASGDDDVPRGDLGTVPKVHAIHGPKNMPRVDYERIFVVDERVTPLGEYVLKDDCPLEHADLRRSIPANGMRHLVAFYLGDYAFTPFRVDNLWFVILSRGVPRIEDRASIGTLLAAARVHIVPNLEPTLAARDAFLREKEQELAERESALFTREQRALESEMETKIAAARLNEFEAELRMREMKLTSLRDYALEMQQSLAKNRKEPATGQTNPRPQFTPEPSA